MAKLSSDGTYCTVEKGDSISKICAQSVSQNWPIKLTPNTDKPTWAKLASINGLKKIVNGSSINYLIHPGNKIYFDSKTAPAATKTASPTDVPKIKQYGLQADTDNQYFAIWEWGRSSDTQAYQVIWYYITGDKHKDTGKYIWFKGSDSSDVKDTISFYSPPENADVIKFKVRPIPKEDESADKKTKTKRFADNKWSETVSITLKDYERPTTPSGLSVESDGFKLTMSLDNVNEDATTIEFQIVKNNSTNSKDIVNKKVPVESAHASHEFTMVAGNEYKVRCRAIRGNLESDWTGYSENKGTPPAAPAWVASGAIKATSETSVQLDWTDVANADTYQIEYTTEKRYFDISNEVQKGPDIDAKKFSTAEITGLESGDEYFFRVRAKNAQGESAWTPIQSIVIGKPPAAPTTWSSTTTAITGEPLTLYWVHNAEDASSQTKFSLELIVNGESRTYDRTWNGTCRIDKYGELHTVEEFTDKEDLDKTKSCVIDTTGYPDEAEIEWRVRTAGILTNSLGDFSIQRTIKVYAPPKLKLNLFKMVKNDDPETESIEYIDEPIEVVDSFPFYISGLADPPTRKPIGYHLSIIANEFYDTVDNTGEPKTVNEGDSVYSKYFDISDSLLVEMSASNVSLQNGIGYTVHCVVSMDSGLTAEDSIPFEVAWSGDQVSPDAEIGINTSDFTAIIRPYCEQYMHTYYKVELSNREYTITDVEIDSRICGDIVAGAFTNTGEQVYFGVSAEGEDVYYCIVETSEMVENVTLSVYRREFDGGFTEIATGLDNMKYTFVTDPHPALDYARYRIVATNTATGLISYHDIPNHPVGGKAVIIQWDEEWSSFDTAGSDDPLAEPSWTGSLLTLPYNIDVSDQNSPDIALIEYAGRKHPVSYYGTQLGETSTWNVAIEKSDEETIYALRRLARWTGDVYVREPSGTGYWANIHVSFSQKHLDMTIPVTLNLTRVEGGI